MEFLKEANKDPISNEIGKTIIFCVSQNHASKITQILNQLANKYWPNKYNSDFAVQVTSNVDGASKKAKDFANNNLNGRSKFKEGYITSKTRICVTVSMMTTGYDCPDILNLCMMRPIFSPTDFVQIRGRGTRKYTFKHIDENKDKLQNEKQSFKLFDFFANCDYFENEFDYDKVLTLPTIGDSNAKSMVVTTGNDVINPNPDLIKTINTPEYPSGMRIDKEMWGQAQADIKDNPEIKTIY